jgi:putative ABC transport system permease protein
MPNQDLRARVLRVFDQTFRITWALQAIAVLVSVLGVIGALTALILQRGREIAMLRAAGALRGQVRVMVLAESGLLGLIGSLLGCGAGLALALLLIHVINRQFFGWTLQTVIEPAVFVQAVALMVGTALLAGLWPARFAASRPPVEAMRTE